MSSHLLNANVDIVRLKLRIHVIGIACQTTNYNITRLKSGKTDIIQRSES